MPVYSSGVLAGIGPETWVNADGTWATLEVRLLWNAAEFRVAGIVLGRGGAVERALQETTSQLRGVVAELRNAGGGARGIVAGIDIGRFATFVTDALRVSCEFIATHFRSGYVRVATADTIRAFL
jgi:hypothetical protein